MIAPNFRSLAYSTEEKRRARAGPPRPPLIMALLHPIALKIKWKLKNERILKWVETGTGFEMGYNWVPHMALLL